MDINSLIGVAISAGTGTAIVQLLIQLGLGHWLNKKFYSFTLEKADRRACADIMLDLISFRSNGKWTDPSDDIDKRALELSDKLLSLNEKNCSEKLNEYIMVQLHERLRRTIQRISGDKIPMPSLDHYYDINELHGELIEMAGNLKKK